MSILSFHQMDSDLDAFPATHAIFSSPDASHDIEPLSGDLNFIQVLQISREKHCIPGYINEYH